MSKKREKTVKNIEKPSKMTKKPGINRQKYQKTVKNEKKTGKYLKNFQKNAKLAKNT